MFERVRDVVVAGRAKKKLHPPEAFVLGMIARAVATVCIFPYLRAKVVLQTQKDTSLSIPKMLAEMHREDGFTAWFQGLGPELTRGVLSAALMLMIKEQIGYAVQTTLQGRSRSQTTTRRRVR